ncbi:MAG: hypothetical protein LBK45_00275 [Tannerellaceae bacterium]|jgi:hypothetical protein|nr:hypothetical protein [Tannerellaceae bacterium]
MRFFIGVLVTFIVITGAILTILALWGIQPISWTIVWKSGLTIMIAFGTLLLVYLCYIIFFNRKK